MFSRLTLGVVSVALLAGGVPVHYLSAQVGVTFTPSGGSYPTGTQLGVNVKFCATPEQYYSTHGITFNGVDVTPTFTQGGGYDPNCVFQQTWNGTVTLVAGTNTLAAGFTAYFFDGADVYYETSYSNSATYTGTDVIVPTITLVAPAGEVSTQYPTITLEWCDNTSLNSASRSITMNGVNRTSSFSYTSLSGAGCGAARAQSTTTTVPLNLGANAVSAYICDNAANCTTQPFTIVRGTPGPATVALRNHNGQFRDRGQCLTIGAGQAAGLSCGDLFVVHAMPAYRTLGRDRSLTLYYGSHQAAPRATVAAWVGQSATTQTPLSVYAELNVAGTKRASATYTAIGLGTTRQIVLGFNASVLVSGIHPFTLLVRNQYAGGVNHDTTLSGELIVVDRSSSVWGDGWWLAGLEQLILAQSANRILWMGADGSGAVYDSLAGGVWRRAAGAFRDSIVRSGSGGSTVYTRRLRHGVQVKFNNAGRHIQTINRTGQVTTFTWSTSPARLVGIQVPADTNIRRTYTIAWDANGMLDSIIDPVGRVLNASVVGDTLTQLVDPDGGVTSFHYDSSRRLTRRTGRRGFGTTYTYANNLHVTRTAIPLAGSDSAVTTVTWWDEQGFAFGNPGGTKATADTTAAFTRVFGARTGVADDATFWVDRWGAPVRIVGAVNDTTRLVRDTLTGLVQEIRNPVGDSASLRYNARGNVDTLRHHTHEGTGTLMARVTRLVYGNGSVPDSPTLVITPVDTTAFLYDTSLRLPTLITAPGNIQARFHYRTSGALRGLLDSVVVDSVRTVNTTTWTRILVNQRTEFYYNSWGNDTLTRSPSGAGTRYLRDVVQRVDRIYDPSPEGHVVWWPHYGVDNRVDSTFACDCPSNFPPQYYPTRYYYSLSGIIDSVKDRGSVFQGWTYDAADRPVVYQDETRQSTGREYRYFGPSGLLDSVRTRNGHTIRRRYDAAGRLTAILYPPRTVHATTTPGDSLGLTYDAAGRMLSATTSASSVIRTYNREGTLRSEIQSNSGLLDTMHYWYDLGDRRTRFYNGSDTLRYTYGGDGQLARLLVRWMPTSLGVDTFDFYWDRLGRRDSLIYRRPGAHVRYGHDLDGRMRMLCSRNPGNTLENDRLEHLVRVDSMLLDGMPTYVYEGAGGNGAGASACAGTMPVTVDIQTFTYDLRHQMLADNTYWYDYDLGGNRTRRRWRSSLLLRDSLRYQAAPSNRLHSRFNGSGWDGDYQHENDGSIRYDGRTGPLSQIAGARRYFMDALGRVVGQQYANDNQWYGDSLGCRYDALGRLFDPCEGGAGTGFDGDNVVRTAAYGTWRYVHGPGLDDPLVSMWSPPGGSTQRFYYLTNGGGRQLAFTDSSGSTDALVELHYSQHAGNLAGGITRSTTFEHARMVAPSVPMLSFYRNRFYDQQTGRWTQEDPIGPTGGINLYAFTGNNPASFSDPFGLCPDSLKSNEQACANWNTNQVAEAKGLFDTERAAGNRGARMSLDMAQNTMIYGVNADQIQSVCGGNTVTGCIKGSRIYLNADRPVAAIAATIAHELVHASGAGQGWEGLAQMGGYLFVADLPMMLAAQAIMGGAGFAPRLPILPSPHNRAVPFGL